MKLSLLVLALLSLVVMTQAAPTNPADFVRVAYKGARDMYRAYRDMKKANWKNSDKYFHARGNHDAARHGAGGRWSARTISNIREWSDRKRGKPAWDSAADQAANRLGRRGGDISIYRPKGLPAQY